MKRAIEIVFTAVAAAAIVVPRPGAGQELDLVQRVGVVDGAPEYTFFRIADLAVGPSREMLVLDGGTKTVTVYDSTGTFVRRFGGEGSGPGEFLAPSRVRVHSDQVLVFDGRSARLTRFDLSGQVLSTQPYPRVAGLDLSRVYALSDGSLLGVSLFRASLGSSHHEPWNRLIRLTNGRADTLLTMEPGAVIWQAPEGLPWGIAPVNLGPTGTVAVAGDSLVAVVDAHAAHLLLYHATPDRFEFERAIAIPITARPVEEELLEEVEAAIRSRRSGLPSKLNLIPPTATSDLTGNAFFDDEGSVWIETQTVGQNGERRWLVVTTPTGATRWVKVPDQLELMSIADDYAYGVWKDEWDVETVAVYRLK